MVSMIFTQVLIVLATFAALVCGVVCTYVGWIIGGPATAAIFGIVAAAMLTLTVLDLIDSRRVYN